MNLPAYDSKEHNVLDYVLPNGTRVSIHQDSSSPDSTGRTIWLGAQVLAVYLHDLFGSTSALGSTSRRGKSRQTVVDVGAGTGLVSLSLASIGFDVLATDLGLIVDGVLGGNVSANDATLAINGTDQPRVETKVLDWFQDPKEWTWDSDTHEDPLGAPFDLVVSADTIYDPSLSQPLLRTLHALASLSRPGQTTSSSSPPVYLALEARDPALISAFLESAEQEWDFKCSRIDHAKIKKLVESPQSGLGWDESAWEGVELWKLRLRKPSAHSRRRSRP
ncbi:hypothetical protein JCM11491_000375 [Sporobolomyces phaffii]